MYIQSEIYNDVNSILYELRALIPQPGDPPAEVPPWRGEDITAYKKKEAAYKTALEAWNEKQRAYKDALNRLNAKSLMVALVRLHDRIPAEELLAAAIAAGRPAGRPPSSGYRGYSPRLRTK
jgi:hypothetical protein